MVGRIANPYIEEIIQTQLLQLNEDFYNISVIDGVLHGLFNKQFTYITTEEVDMQFLLDILCNNEEYEKEM